MSPNSGGRRNPQVCAAAATVNENRDGLNRAWRNGSKVVGDGMFGSSIAISREICRIQNADDAADNNSDGERRSPKWSRPAGNSTSRRGANMVDGGTS
jgi:hypothetical protein